MVRLFKVTFDGFLSPILTVTAKNVNEAATKSVNQLKDHENCGLRDIKTVELIGEGN